VASDSAKVVRLLAEKLLDKEILVEYFSEEISFSCSSSVNGSGDGEMT